MQKKLALLGFALFACTGIYLVLGVIVPELIALPVMCVGTLLLK